MSAQSANWLLTATKAGDLPKVLSLMADDVIFMVPGQKPFGKEAFAAGFRGQSNFQIDGKSEIQEIHVLGDWAYLRNHVTVTVTPRDGGKATTRSGFTLTILHKQRAGNWVLVRDANLMTTKG